MARRRKGVRSRTIGLDLNKMKHECRSYLLEAGMEVVGELAEKVAEEANRLSRKIEAKDLPDDFLRAVHGVHFKHPYTKRRGPNKTGGSDSGPIKDSVFAQESTKVPWSYLVCCPAWYAHFIEYGTDAHTMPVGSKKGKSVMVFPGTNEHKGKVVLTKKVDHHGIKKHPFLRPAADRAEQFARKILEEKGFLKS